MTDKKLSFSDVKERLQETLTNKLKENPIPGENGFTLIEGFMTMPLNDSISSSLVLGGPRVPIIGLVGKTTGRVYIYALKALLPDLNI